MHSHLDHEECLESVMLNGPVNHVLEFVVDMIAETGVRHGQLNLISVNFSKSYTHGGTTHRHWLFPVTDGSGG